MAPKKKKAPPPPPDDLCDELLGSESDLELKAKHFLPPLTVPVR